MGVEGKLHHEGGQLTRIHCKKPPSTFCNWA
jgi:hypothetical protein